MPSKTPRRSVLRHRSDLAALFHFAALCGGSAALASIGCGSDGSGGQGGAGSSSIAGSTSGSNAGPGGAQNAAGGPAGAAPVAGTTPTSGAASFAGTPSAGTTSMSGSAGAAGTGMPGGALGSGGASTSAGNPSTGGTGPGGGSGAGGAAGGLAGSPQAGGSPSTGGQSSSDPATYFASLRCGAKYTALGDGGWQFCLRLEDGGGACAKGTAAFDRVTMAGGAAITNVAQISGVGDGSVAVVTTTGALHIGASATSISATPLIASGVVNVSGGYHSRVALVRMGQGFSAMAWTDSGTPAPVALPVGVQPVQVSGNYGIACVLDNKGDVYCWDAGGNHGLMVTATPSKLDLGKPVKLISVGQNSVCGVSFTNTLECKAAWYDNPWLPTEGMAPNFQVKQSTFPMVREVHAGFRQGIVVRGDGAAFYLAGTGAGMDNPGTQFMGATDVIASGGDRGNACVQTSAGAVYCHVGGMTVPATLAGAPLKASAATCPM